MAAQCTFIEAPLDRWIKVAEYREGRTALLIQVAIGACILGIKTNGPLAYGVDGARPAGIWNSPNIPNAPATFRLSRLLDGDLVAQEWWAYVIGGSLPMPGPVSIDLSSTVGPFTVPAQVTSITMTAIGGGGWTRSGDGSPGQVTQSYGGGGGGAFARSTLPVTPGQFIYYQTGQGQVVSSGGGSAAIPSWLSLVPGQPASALQGVLAASGNANAAPPSSVGGAAGLAAASLGQEVQDGGAGGDGCPESGPGADDANGGGGGGAGSTGVPGVAGTAGTTVAVGAGGAIGGGDGGGTASPNPGLAPGFGFSPGGAAGGWGSQETQGVPPVFQSAPPGQITLSWDVPATNSVPVTVLESWSDASETPGMPGNGPGVESGATFQVSLPTLSDESKAVLKSLLARASGQTQEVIDEQQ
jgi:hypothetical protein